MEKLKENIWVLVFAMAFNVLGLMAYGAITKHKNAASVEYVNKENIKQDNICKETAINFKTEIDKKADKIELEALKQNQSDFKSKIETMDDRIYDLWKLQFKEDDK